MPCRSTRSRMSSGTAMAGCVSLSWMAAWSASDDSSPCCCLCRRTRSCSDADAKKNSWRSRRSCAGRRVVAGVEDARDRLEAHAVGQRADVVAAVEVLERDRIGGARRPQAQRVDVLPAPTGDRRVERHRGHRFRRDPDVAGAPVAVRRPPPRCRRSPPCTTTSGRSNSHGLPNDSHSSGISCCQPSLTTCRKMPWS